MLTVKCPHCSTALRLRQAPASGKVKCPKCSGVVPTSGSPQSVKKRAPAAVATPTDPDDESFDFARINFPSASGVSAVSHFPVANQRMQVYDGPIPGDPLDMAAEEDDQAASASGGPVAAASKKKTSPMLVVGILGGLGVGVIGVVLVGVFLVGGGGGGSSTAPDPLVSLKASAPSGYQAIGHYGCVTLLPKGEVSKPDMRTVIADDTSIVSSDASGSFFFFGAMDGGSRELDKEQMRKKASRQLGGDLLGGTPTERNGYQGIKGKLDGSLFLPNMMVEVYHHDGRFVILGCAPLSFESDPSVQMSVDRQLEDEEMKLFYESFKIGPKPSGWLF